MSLETGLAAINLEMPPRIPRTEYSADSYHFELVSRVTGLPVTADSPATERRAASAAFRRAWNYDFIWHTAVGGTDLGDYRTDMGHAVYASDGSDRRDADARVRWSPESVLAFSPVDSLPSWSHSDLVSRFNDDYARQREQEPDAVTMTGIYITLVSGLIDMLGWDALLTAAGTDPAAFGALATRYTDWVLQFFRAFADSDAPLIMVHDDIVWSSGPFVHPDWYREYVFANYRRLFDPLREAGKKIAYTSDGDYTMFVSDIADAGANGFVMEPLTDMALIAERYGKTHFFIGNADTRILLGGSREEIRAEVERCMSIGHDCPGYFLAVGNHIPANTPVESALYYNECYEQMMDR
jgi:hypothetical protein